MTEIDKLDTESRYLVNMYSTARQFKNAIDSNDKVIITKNTVINKIFPYIVNKSFSCEVYLKMIIRYHGDSFSNIHNIKDLLEASKIKSDFAEYMQDNIFKDDATYNLEKLNRNIESISNAFVEWRYIYEKKDLCVAEGTLIILNSYLDRYCKNIIKDKCGIDMDKFPYI